MAVVTDLDKVNCVVTDIMKRHYGDRLAKIILFGSYARGDFDEESDVDYLVVLNEEKIYPFTEMRTYSSTLSKFYLDTFIHVSAIPVSEKQLSESTKLFYREVRKDGKIIYEQPS